MPPKKGKATKSGKAAKKKGQQQAFEVQRAKAKDQYLADKTFGLKNKKKSKKKSNRKPAMVQLYGVNYVNGKYQGDGIGGHFTFNKNF